MRYKIFLTRKQVPEIWLNFADLVSIVASATGKRKSTVERQISDYSIRACQDGERYVLDTTSRRVAKHWKPKRANCGVLKQLYEACLHIDSWLTFGLQNVLDEIKAIRVPENEVLTKIAKSRI